MEKFVQLRLAKFDGVAEGTIAAEELDRDNEIMDYLASKPYFQAWSNSVLQDSQGKSLGNVRLQHNAQRVIGKVTAIKFDDATKTIKVAVQVVEEEAKKMLELGLLTGFSVGGSYGKRTPLPNGATRYVAIPGELSVVDRPSVPGATFTLVHASGARELKKFAKDPDSTGKTEAATNMLKRGFPASQVGEVLRLPLGEVYRLAYVAKQAK